MGQILRVTKAFSVLSDPTGHVYTPGELVDADHPHVKGRENHFETVEAHVSARAASETASAAPGERRRRARSAAKGKGVAPEVEAESESAAVEPPAGPDED